MKERNLVMTSTKKKMKLITKILIIGVLFLAYSLIEPYWTETKESIIYNATLSAKFDGLKIVFIADIHHGPFFSRERVEKLVNSVNKMNPDIVLIGGDYVQSDPKYIIPCFEELKGLKANLGKYGVLGNHDHWEDAALCKKEARNADITLLDNQATWIVKDGERIKIGGVGDISEDTQDVLPTVADVQKEDFVILLSHNPDYIEYMNNDKVDLMLSGHTHGGQCTLFGLWAPLVPSEFGNKYRTGLFEKGKTTLLVTNGIGVMTPPVRFFARPQINVIYLKKS
jgi:uncharacterized protein